VRGAAAACARLRDRLRDERGWTLIELLVAMAIFTFVLGAALTLFETSVKLAPKEQERAAAFREAQTGLSGMVREIRDANEILELTPNVIDFIVQRQGGQQVHVRYECGVADTDVSPALRKCQRSQAVWVPPAPMPALDTPRTVIGRMLNAPAADPVFAYTLPPVDAVDPEDDPLDAAEPPQRTWPTYIDVKVKVPAKGRLADGGYTHSVSFSGAAYLRNLEARQSPYNSGS